MVSGAIHADHFAHGKSFAGQAFLLSVHSFLYQTDLDAEAACHSIQHQVMLSVYT